MRGGFLFSRKAYIICVQKPATEGNLLGAALAGPVFYIVSECSNPLTELGTPGPIRTEERMPAAPMKTIVFVSHSPRARNTTTNNPCAPNFLHFSQKIAHIWQ